MSFRSRFMATVSAALLSAALVVPQAIAEETKPVIVFAAASLKNALDAISADWQKANEGKSVKTSYAASSALAKQLEQDAPADIFISADLDWMDYVEKKALIDNQTRANLLGNAQRFSAPDSPIELRVGTDEDARMGFIEVIDHGEGVPEQIRDQIFQRFWRADTSRARETGGSGLGLSIVASIVEALHGSVDVRDSAGGGATFRVAFPLAADQDAAAHALIETQPIQRLDLPRG